MLTATLASILHERLVLFARLNKDINISRVTIVFGCVFEASRDKV